MQRFSQILYSTLKVLLFWCLLISSWTVHAAPPPPSNTAGLCGENSYYGQLRLAWLQSKPKYRKWITGSADTPYNLYTLQGETNNVLKYAGYCQDMYVLDELANLYLGAMDTMDETDEYVFYYYPGGPRLSTHTLDNKQQMWLDTSGQESILVSSQFLYLLSHALHIISKLGSQQHTQAMLNLMEDIPGILGAHYDRWIFSKPGPFQVKGWGCKVNGENVTTGMSHQEFVVKKTHRQLGDRNSASYCNAVTDTDMWIIAGVTHLVAANHSNSEAIPVTRERYDRYIEYIRAGAELLESRITYKQLIDWEGKPVLGANFDLGAWDDHPTYAYANYTNTLYPESYIAAKIIFMASGVGWDLSHARRFVHVFDTLYENREIMGLDFPDGMFMTRLANQFLYGTFNGDFSQPLFTNFMDGTNGWFRVGYEKRKGFGYGPWDMSISALTGGYGFWSRYNKNYEKLYHALVTMLQPNNPAVYKHIAEHYVENHWNGFRRTRSNDFQKQPANIATPRIVIQLLPSLCFLKQVRDVGMLR